MARPVRPPRSARTDGGIVQVLRPRPASVGARPAQPSARGRPRPSPSGVPGWPPGELPVALPAVQAVATPAQEVEELEVILASPRPEDLRALLTRTLLDPVERPGQVGVGPYVGVKDDFDCAIPG